MRILLLFVATSFLLIGFFSTCIGQSACSGFEYKIQKEDIPEGFIFVKHMRLDGAKGGLVHYSYLAATTPDSICITIASPCIRPNTNVTIETNNGEVVYKLERYSSKIFVELSKSRLYFIKFDFVDHSSCPKCAVAILSRKTD